MFGKLSAFCNDPPQSKAKTAVLGLTSHAKVPHSKRKMIYKRDETVPSRHNKTPLRKIIVEDKLQGARFRILNQILYANSSDYALEYFSRNGDDFQAYHQGYRQQSAKWAVRPVDEIIAYLSRRTDLKKNLILDLGCGDAHIQEALSRKGYERISSFDLAKAKPYVEVADIAHLPLEDSTASLCVFCLSLMGTNYLQFLREAARTLKEQGEMLIAEVESRTKRWDKFIELVTRVGFQLVNDGIILGDLREEQKHSSGSGYNQKGRSQGRYFRIMHFVKKGTNAKLIIYNNGQAMTLEEFASLALEGCLYKRR